MLRNPLYVISDDKSHEYLIKKGLNVFGSPNGNGYITYNKSNQNNLSADSNQWIVAVSNHKGIITSDNWLKVQHQLDNNKSKMPRIGTGKNHSLFSGKNKNNIPYEYYVCSGKQNKYLNKCTTKNIRVDKLDKILTRKLKIYNKTALMKTLRDSIDNTCCDFKSNQISSIEYEIQENKVSMDNLIKQLAKSASSAVSDRLMNEINLLNKNIVRLKKQLETIELEQSHDKKTNIDIKNIINVLNSFSDTIEYIDDTAQKRFLIQTLIKSAVWDSDNNNVEIIFNTH